MTRLESGNQSGVQFWNLAIGDTSPVSAFMRTTVQFSPKKLAVPVNHLPSGDQNICWKMPFRSSFRTTSLLARSRISIPVLVKHETCFPLGLQTAHGHSPASP